MMSAEGWVVKGTRRIAEVANIIGKWSPTQDSFGLSVSATATTIDAAADTECTADYLYVSTETL